MCLRWVCLKTLVFLCRRFSSTTSRRPSFDRRRRTTSTTCPAWSPCRWRYTDSKSRSSYFSRLQKIIPYLETHLSFAFYVTDISSKKLCHRRLVYMYSDYSVTICTTRAVPFYRGPSDLLPLKKYVEQVSSYSSCYRNLASSENLLFLL